MEKTSLVSRVAGFLDRLIVFAWLVTLAFAVSMPLLQSSVANAASGNVFEEPVTITKATYTEVNIDPSDTYGAALMDIRVYEMWQTFLLTVLVFGLFLYSYGLL